MGNVYNIKKGRGLESKVPRISRMKTDMQCNFKQNLDKKQGCGYTYTLMATKILKYEDFR